MAEQETPERRVKLDLTVNVPTLLTLLGFIITVAVTGVRTYNDFDNRLNLVSYEVSTSKDRISALEGAMVALRTEQNGQVQMLRTEIREDLSEIKRQLASLIFNSKPMGAQRD